MKQNIEIYLADAKPCTRVVLVHGIIITDFFKFWWNLVILIGILCKKRKNSAKIGMVGRNDILNVFILYHILIKNVFPSVPIS